MQFRLVRLGYAVSAYPHTLLPRMVASTLEPSDVLALELALRHQDRSRDKLRRLKITLDAHRGGDNRQPLGD